MSDPATDLFDKLKTLPPQRLAEVADFVDFLAAKEARRAALDRLLELAPALEAAGAPRPSEAELAAEIAAARAERRAQRSASQDSDRS
jgi:hypothetical protein